MRIYTTFPISMLEGELERDWQARYERWATLYDEEHQIAGWSRDGLSRRLELLLRLLAAAGLKTGSLILDLGAGPGTYTRAIHHMGHSCIGMDYSRKVIQVAKKKGNGEQYVQGEAYNLPFHDGKFDAVVCIGVLQSLGQLEDALREVNRVLAPGGLLFLDGLNSVFWIHGLRHWRQALKGEKERMKFYNSYRLCKEAERIGFWENKLHWLAIPEIFQRWVNRHSGKKISPLVSRFLGHAFLLQARKKN